MSKAINAEELQPHPSPSLPVAPANTCRRPLAPLLYLNKPYNDKTYNHKPYNDKPYNDKPYCHYSPLCLCKPLSLLRLSCSSFCNFTAVSLCLSLRRMKQTSAMRSSSSSSSKKSNRQEQRQQERQQQHGTAWHSAVRHRLKQLPACTLTAASSAARTCC